MEIAVESSASRLSDEAMRRMNQNWKRKYDFEYLDDEEEERRFRIFQKNFKEIEKNNTENESCFLLLSPYSDRTDAEFFIGEVPEDMLDDIFLRNSARQVECGACKRRFQLEQLDKKKQRISKVYSLRSIG